MAVDFSLTKRSPGMLPYDRDLRETVVDYFQNMEKKKM